MSICADTCQHAGEIQMVCMWGAESDAIWWHMSAHISTCRHISAYVGMSKCADTCQHADKVQMVCIRDAESYATCWHISAHVGMSTCADTCQHGGKVQLVGIRGAESDVICWHMLAHVSRCWHIPTNVSMSICADTSAWKLGPNGWYQRCLEWWHMSAHISTCRHVFFSNSKTFFCHSKHIHNSYIKVRIWQWGILKHSLLVPQVFKL